MDYITLNNGVKMPQLGYGVYQVSQEDCERCVLDALQVGYRSIDTAQTYFNEEQVGTAIERSGVDRKEIFLTTKVWIEHYGYEEAKASVLESLRKLRTDYLDLCLLHQPFADYYGAWRALEELYEAGKIRSIKVFSLFIFFIFKSELFKNFLQMLHIYFQWFAAKIFCRKLNVRAGIIFIKIQHRISFAVFFI